MLRALVPGGTFLLNTPFRPDEIWDHLPRVVQEQLIAKKAKLLRHRRLPGGPRQRHGRPHQHDHAGVLLRHSGVLPRDEAIAAIKHVDPKDLWQEGRGSRPEESESRGQNPGTSAIEVKVPETITSTVEMPPPFSSDAPQFVRERAGRDHARARATICR